MATPSTQTGSRYLGGAGQGGRRSDDRTQRHARPAGVPFICEEVRPGRSGRSLTRAALQILEFFGIKIGFWEMLGAGRIHSRRDALYDPIGYLSRINVGRPP